MRVFRFWKFSTVKRLSAVAALVVVGLAGTPAHANAVFEFDQVGSNVIGTLSGSLTLLQPIQENVGNFGMGSIDVNPVSSLIQVDQYGIADLDEYKVTGPAAFGSNLYSYGALPSTNIAFWLFGRAGTLYITEGINDLNLTGTATWANENFASMGLTPGAYVYTLSNDGGQTFNGDTFTIQIGEVPLPASLSLLATALALLLALGCFAWRRRRNSPSLALGTA